MTDALNCLSTILLLIEKYSILFYRCISVTNNIILLYVTEAHQTSKCTFKAMQSEYEQFVDMFADVILYTHLCEVLFVWHFYSKNIIEAQSPPHIGLKSMDIFWKNWMAKFQMNSKPTFCAVFFSFKSYHISWKSDISSTVHFFGNVTTEFVLPILNSKNDQLFNPNDSIFSRAPKVCFII